MGSPEKHCVCRQKESGFMILCEMCEVWYHGSCMGESKKTVASMETYFCPWCRGYKNALNILSKKQDDVLERVKSLSEAAKGPSKDASSMETLKKELESKLLHISEKVKLLSEAAEGPSEDVVSMETLKKEFDSKLLELSKLQVTCNNLKCENISFVKTIQELRGELEVKEGELQKTKRELCEARENNSECKENLCKEYQEELAKCHVELSKLQVTCDNLNSENISFVKTIQELRGELKVKEEELQKSDLELCEAREVNGEQKENLRKEYQEELDECHLTISSLKREIKEFKKSVKKRKLSLSQR